MTSPSISVITVCMNRLEHLRAAASRVAQWEHHFEHIVVDWCSQRPIERDHLPSDQRLRLVRVDGVADWHPGQAYNFAAYCAQGEWLFRLDADCWVQNLDPTLLIHQTEIPAWVANASQEGSLGEILVLAEKFWGIGGYSELMRGYGFEGKDFVYRLKPRTTRPVDLSLLNRFTSSPTDPSCGLLCGIRMLLLEHSNVRARPTTVLLRHQCRGLLDAGVRPTGSSVLITGCGRWVRCRNCRRRSLKRRVV